MPENEIVCISFEIETGILTSNQFLCEIERPFTDLKNKNAKLAGKTYKIIYQMFTKPHPKGNKIPSW